MYNITGFIVATRTESNGDVTVALQRTVEDGGRTTLHTVSKRQQLWFSIENADRRYEALTYQANATNLLAEVRS